MKYAPYGTLKVFLPYGNKCDPKNVQNNSLLTISLLVTGQFAQKYCFFVNIYEFIDKRAKNTKTKQNLTQLNLFSLKLSTHNVYFICNFLRKNNICGRIDLGEFSGHARSYKAVGGNPGATCCETMISVAPGLAQTLSTTKEK